MFPILPEVIPVLLASSPPTLFPMGPATADTASSRQRARKDPFRRRNSSSSLSFTRATKRQRTSIEIAAAPDPARNAKRQRRRSSGIKKLLKWPNRSSANGYEKLPKRSDTLQMAVIDDDQAENTIMNAGYDKVLSASGCQEEQEHGPKKRRPTFATVFEGFKNWKLFGNKRKDSALEDQIPRTSSELPEFNVDFYELQPLPGLHGDAHDQNQVRYFNPHYSSYAELGMLRYNHSDDRLISGAGPSTYWQHENFQNRPFCHVTPNASICDRSSIVSSHDVADSFGTPTPVTNAEAGVYSDPHRWYSLRDWSPGPSRNLNTNGRRNSILSPKEVARKAANVFSGRGSRPVSPTTTSRRTQSRTPSLFTISTPPTFGADPDLRFNFTFNDIGVLPEADEEDGEDDLSSGPSAPPIPIFTSYEALSRSSSMFPLYTPDDNISNPASPTQSLSNGSSRASSTHLQTSSLCPSSPTLAPSTPGSNTQTSPFNLPSPTFPRYSRPVRRRLPTLASSRYSRAPNGAEVYSPTSPPLGTQHLYSQAQAQHLGNYPTIQVPTSAYSQDAITQASTTLFTQPHDSFLQPHPVGSHPHNPNDRLSPLARSIRSNPTSLANSCTTQLSDRTARSQATAVDHEYEDEGLALTRMNDLRTALTESVVDEGDKMDFGDSEPGGSGFEYREGWSGPRTGNAYVAAEHGYSESGDGYGNSVRWEEGVLERDTEGSRRECDKNCCGQRGRKRTRLPGRHETRMLPWDDDDDDDDDVEMDG